MLLSLSTIMKGSHVHVYKTAGELQEFIIKNLQSVSTAFLSISILVIG